jgi:hypothetical protein
MYFCIVVYKSASSLESLLNKNGGSKLLQAKVNKRAERLVKFSENPFLRQELDHIDSQESEHEENSEEMAKRKHREMMEEDGFTLVEAADEQNVNRIKTRDDIIGTTIQGITQEKAREIWEKQQQKETKNTAGSYTTGKEKKELIRNDFYMF